MEIQAVRCPVCGDSLPPGSRCPKDGTEIPTIHLIGVGSKIGDYILEEKLGQGGMGEVWRGRHAVIGKRAAIKLLNLRHKTNPDVLTRFTREALAVNQIRHKNIVDIFALGELPDGLPYLVMEYLEGYPLSVYLKERGPLPFQEILEIMGPVCRGLQAVHDAGIIHRDLKPENIFLIPAKDEPLQVKLLDFGIAKLAAQDVEGLTQTDTSFGTPAYMSPEQCRGAKNVDHRADIYSLGILLFEMICGCTPFAKPGDGFGKVMMRHLTEPAPRASTRVTGREVPAAVDALLCRMLAKEPDERPGRCLDVYEELSRAVGGLAHERADDLAGPKAVYVVDPEMARAKTASVESLLIPVETPRWGKRSALLGVGLGVALTIGLQIFYFLRPWEAKGEERVASAPVSAPASPLVASAPASVPASAPTSDPDSLATSAPAAPTEMTLHLISTPKGARVFLDEKLLGKTPLTEAIPYPDGPLALRFEKEGFAPETMECAPGESCRLEVRLAKKRAPKPERPPADPEKPGRDAIVTPPKYR